ncbi:MAG: 2-oxoacid:ferredoxin oxidoreductase subunit beta, partial [Novosphingobium sp.]|nr:2-oxoacid:ferredoxin oxidoreductase subunit beta [Novosphingobium sp.]
EDQQLWLENGAPMLFDGGTKGIAMDVDTLSLKIVDVVDGDWESAGVIVHDVTNRAVAYMLVDLRVAPKFREFPMALGVIYDDPKPTFDSDVVAEREKSSGGRVADLGKLLGKGQTWTVEG